MLDPPYSLVKEAHRAVRSISISSVVVGYSNSPAAKFMAALGVPSGDEGVRALLGKVDLFVVDKKSSYRGDCRHMSTEMRNRNESRKVAEQLLAMIDEHEWM